MENVCGIWSFAMVIIVISLYSKNYCHFMKHRCSANKRNNTSYEDQNSNKIKIERIKDLVNK